MADVSITAGSVTADSTASLAQGTSSANITAGKIVYRDSTDSYTIKLADTSTTTKAAAVGIALTGSSVGQPVVYCTSGTVNLGGNVLVRGTVYSVADTAGGLRPVADNGAGDCVTVVGVATATNTLKVSIIASSVAV
jgi:hypothetical protein